MLFALKSSDGIHWSLMTAEPVITKGAFDSQNLAFWDSVRGEYRAYLRDFRGKRALATSGTCTSRDFVEWSEPVFLKYTDYAPSHVQPVLYQRHHSVLPRAPSLPMAFPHAASITAGRNQPGDFPNGIRELVASVLPTQLPNPKMPSPLPSKRVHLRSTAPESPVLKEPHPNGSC